MKELARTYVKYGVPSDLASKYEQLALSATSFRALSKTLLKQNYMLNDNEIEIVKNYLNRQPIPLEIVQKLLENNNFTCCCCSGAKSDSYIIHHIVKYEESQDNSYENLAVLCPNDHDLAHRGTGLTNSLTGDQIRKEKEKWEQLVKVRRLVAASPAELKIFYLSIPRYQEISKEIERLKSIISDKEDVASMSMAALKAERENNEVKITRLVDEKNNLELQIKSLIGKLAHFQPEQHTSLYNTGLNLFLTGDINGALEALSEIELDSQLEEIIDAHNTVYKSLKGNIDSRLLRVNLLFINGNEQQACFFGGETLKICEELCDKHPELLSQLAICFERIGSLYYCSNYIDEAEVLFQSGLNLCHYLIDNNDPLITPLIPDFLHNLGTIHYSRNELEEAKEFLENSLYWYLDLYNIYSNFEELSPNPLANSLVKNYVNLSVTYQALNLTTEALDAIKEADKLKSGLPSPDVNSAYQVELNSRYLSSKASVLLNSGNACEAGNNFKNLILTLEEQAKANPKKHTRELVNTYLEMCAALFMKDIGKTETETEMTYYCNLAMQKAKELISIEPEGDPSPLAYALMYNTLNNMHKGTISSSDFENLEKANLLVTNLKPDEGDQNLRGGIRMLNELIQKVPK